MLPRAILHLLCAAAWAQTVTVRAGKTVSLPIEDYVAGVLRGEAMGMLEEEALRAMAVAARSYAVAHRGRHSSEGFDFCESTHCQDFRTGAVEERLRRAAGITEGELVWHQGAVARTYYHKHCGGRTEAGSAMWPGLNAPYLRAVEDSHCLSSRREWTARMDARDFAVARRSGTGRVQQARWNGRLLPFEQLQRAAGPTLLSALFEMDGAMARGHGEGHGVGLCQSGARGRARAGQSYRQILARYYPGTSVGVTARGLSWSRVRGERVEVMAQGEDQAVVGVAEQALREAEARAGWKALALVRVRVYPTVEAFRNATGEPGWVAASTLNGLVRMQPAEVLRSRGVLETTLVHEMLHVLVEGRAKPGLPRWFREDVVRYLAGERKALAALAARYSREAVLSWIEHGLPPEVARSRASQPAGKSK